MQAQNNLLIPTLKEVEYGAWSVNKLLNISYNDHPRSD